MSTKKLLSSDIIDDESTIHITFYSSIKHTTGPHCHDFFEFFFVTRGTAVHRLKDEENLIKEGNLVFIRPDDMHYYKQYKNEDCQFINIAFSSETAYAIFDFLERGPALVHLLSCKSPPEIELPDTEKDNLHYKLNNLLAIPPAEKRRVKRESKLLLSELFVKFFSGTHGDAAADLPRWLYPLCEQMKEKKNYTSGLPAMLEASSKSHEHLCRVFKKHLGKSPTEFINTLRLEYSAKLLTYTDYDILSVAMESGFQNLSYFYQLFKKQYGLTPAAFRKKNQQLLLL